jgi:hypothetical protein
VSRLIDPRTGEPWQPTSPPDDATGCRLRLAHRLPEILAKRVRFVSMNPAGKPTAPLRASPFAVPVHRLDRALEVVTALDALRSLSRPQLEALLGYDCRRILASLFKAGVAAQGAMGYHPEIPGRLPKVWQLVDHAAVHRRFVRRYARVLGTRGAFDGEAALPRRAGPAVRHDLLAAEALISARDASDGLVAGVVGERGARISLEYREPFVCQGDGVWLRADGLPVLLELMGEIRTAQLSEKGWRLTATVATQDVALVVLLRPGYDTRQVERVRDILARSAGRAFRVAGGVENRPGSRIGVARYEDWFTADGRLLPAARQGVALTSRGPTALFDPSVVPRNTRMRQPRLQPGLYGW